MSGANFFQVLTLPDPAAGANFTYTIPDGEIWCVQAITFKFVSAVTILTRQARLLVEDSGGVTWFSSAAGIAITLSQTVRVGFFAGNTNDGIAGVCSNGGLPGLGLELPPRHRLFSAFSGIAVADAISEVRIAGVRTPVGLWP